MNKLIKILKKILLMFAVFYTSLTISNQLLIYYGISSNFFMDNFAFGILLSLVLSLIYVLLSVNNQD